MRSQIRRICDVDEIPETCLRPSEWIEHGSIVSELVDGGHIFLEDGVVWVLQGQIEPTDDPGVVEPRVCAWPIDEWLADGLAMRVRDLDEDEVGSLAELGITPRW